MDMIFMNMENSNTNEIHNFVLNLSQRLDSRSSNKHVILITLIILLLLNIYYAWKNVRQQNKNNKLEIKSPNWKDEFELPGDSYSVSNIQDYIDYIIKT